jgi:hypothetical protein
MRPPSVAQIRHTSCSLSTAAWRRALLTTGCKQGPATRSIVSRQALPIRLRARAVDHFPIPIFGTASQVLFNYSSPPPPSAAIRGRRGDDRADFDQGAPAVLDQFFRVGVGNHVVCPAVQDGRFQFYRRSRPELLPRRAKQDQPGLATVDVHGDGPAPGLANDYLGLVLVELGLGDADGFVEIIVGQSRVDDLVAVLGQVGRRVVPSAPQHEVKPASVKTRL